MPGNRQPTLPEAPYPTGNARCDRDPGVSPNSGDQNWPIRIVVRPFVRSAYAKRMRSCGCSSPNGGTPLNAPKKSASSVALGDHLPSTGVLLKVKLIRVFRTSPSVKNLSVVSATWAAYSAFCPCPNAPNLLRLVKKVALTKPLMVSVCPSPNLTTCWAAAVRTLPRMKTVARAKRETDAIRVLMTPPDMIGP